MDARYAAPRRIITTQWNRLVIGLADPGLIARRRTTKMFVSDDYNRLSRATTYRLELQVRVALNDAPDEGRTRVGQLIEARLKPGGAGSP